MGLPQNGQKRRRLQEPSVGRGTAYSLPLTIRKLSSRKQVDQAVTSLRASRAIR